jgi:hypothetical protein
MPETRISGLLDFWLLAFWRKRYVGGKPRIL